MFGLIKSKPRCPIDNFQREWIESQFSWLINELGLNDLQSLPVILPDRAHFPYMCCVSLEEIHEQMHVVAKYMNVDTNLLSLKFYKGKEHAFREAEADRESGNCHKVGDRYEIVFRKPCLEEGQYFMPQLIHEIGCVAIMGLLDQKYRDDGEYLVDLYAVFCGMGVVAANSAVQEIYADNGGWSSWSAEHFSYMSMDMYGYALALFALIRSEPKPVWQSKLRPDVRSAFKKSIRYLQDPSTSTIAK